MRKPSHLFQKLELIRISNSHSCVLRLIMYGKWIPKLCLPPMDISMKMLTWSNLEEAEYIAAFDASKEAVWVRKFISGLGVVPTIEKPINMYCDNTGAIAIANESGNTKGANITVPKFTTSSANWKDLERCLGTFKEDKDQEMGRASYGLPPKIIQAILRSIGDIIASGHLIGRSVVRYRTTKGFDLGSCEDIGQNRKLRFWFLFSDQVLGIGQLVAPEILQSYAWVNGSKEFDGLMLMTWSLRSNEIWKSSMLNDLAKGVKNSVCTASRESFFMRLAPRDTRPCCESEFLIGLRKEFDGFVQNYNMHSLGKTVNELHAMLKLHEQTLTLPKNNAPALHAIRAGKVQKAKIPLKPKRKDSAKDQSVMSVVETDTEEGTVSGLRASRKLKPGALSLYMGNGQREAVEAIGNLIISP
ncbi:hypothetical protein Tco_0099809 [Tanacetum coccineum]